MSKRIGRVSRRWQGRDPLHYRTWRTYLPLLARAMLITIAVMILSTAVLLGVVYA